jgi:quinol monooxygenase YgiN
VYARSTTIQGRLDLIDSGIEFCRDEVMPALTSMAGCAGLSMLADRASGRCIVTSSWESEEAMRATATTVSGIRSRGEEVLGGAAEVQEWEIAILHRKHPAAAGACARVTWMKADASQVERAVDVVRLGVVPRVDELDGFCSISLFVDRGTGMACVTATYDDLAALEASRGTASSLRTQVTAEVPGAQMLEVEEFELSLAHLHVPETV